MYENYLEFAKDLALEAGTVIKNSFETRSAVSRTKPDQSPVTDTDEAVNQLVIERVSDKFPGHAVLGEEGNFGPEAAQYKWICDPIDGTKPFILGVPNCVFMLALMDQNELIVAVVNDPFSESLYHATKGGGAFCNDLPIRVNNQSLGAGYTLLGTESFPFVERIRKAGGQVEPVSGSGYKSMMIAKGTAVANIRVKASFYDMATAALIVEEAGGLVTSLDGKRLRLDSTSIGGAIISNQAAHPELVQIARTVLDAVGD